MNDSKTSKSKKEQKTSFKEIIIEPEEKEDVEDVEPIEDKDFGLSSDEYEVEIAEIERRRKAKLPVLEKDVPLTTKNVDLEKKDDE